MRADELLIICKGGVGKLITNITIAREKCIFCTVHFWNYNSNTSTEVKTKNRIKLYLFVFEIGKIELLIKTTKQRLESKANAKKQTK